LAAAIPRVAEAGLRHVELALRPHSMGGLEIPEDVVLTERSTAEAVAAIQELLARHGVAVATCNIGGVDPGSDDGLEILSRRLRCARRWFDAPLAVTGAGQASDHRAGMRLVENLTALGDLAGELGMILSLETHQGPTQNAQAMTRLMERVDHPAVRINFDTANILYYNEDADPVAELRQVFPYVASIHLKDSRGRFEDWYFPAIGDGGAVNFDELLDFLRASDFAGPLTIEIEGIRSEPEPGLDERQERVVRSVTHLKKLGYFGSFSPG
jgi:inosose dehydratase